MHNSGSRHPFVLAALFVSALAFGAASRLVGVCGPFTDVSDPAFCPFVLEIYTLGITAGTTPTTYDPSSSVSRLQMAAFLSRTVDADLKRGSRRAALDQFWTTKYNSTGFTSVGDAPLFLKSDGLDIWVANQSSGSVSRVRGSDGRVLETWTGASFATGVLVATGRVFVSGFMSPGRLYRINPTQAAGAVETVASNLGILSEGIAFDGQRVWTANYGGSVSIVTPATAIPWTVTTVTAGFDAPMGILHDSANIWVTDLVANTLLKLDVIGGILQTVTVGDGPRIPAFDGTNIWVPNHNSNSVSVVRASSGTVLQTLTGTGLDGPISAAFDGQRVLVTNQHGGNVSLWKAADLTPIASVGIGGVGPSPYGACSDGVNFWIALNGTGQLARF